MYLVLLANGDWQKYNKNCQEKLDDPEDCDSKQQSYTSREKDRKICVVNSVNRGKYSTIQYAVYIALQGTLIPRHCLTGARVNFGSCLAGRRWVLRPADFS